MKAHYKTRNGRLVFEIEGDTPKAIFRGVADLQNLFESDDACGCCSGTNLQYRVRTIDDNDYYELFCMDCSAALNYGQHKKGGGLFPKRKDADGKPFPNNGWKRWTGKAIEAPARATA